jgi:hypothetical protein
MKCLKSTSTSSSVVFQPRKISIFLRPVKHPNKYGQIYLGNPGLSPDTRVKEHNKSTRPEHSDKWTVAGQSTNLGHRICTKTLSQIQIHGPYEQGCDFEESNANSMNTEDGFCLRSRGHFSPPAWKNEGGSLVGIFWGGSPGRLTRAHWDFSAWTLLFRAPIRLGYFFSSLFLPTGSSPLPLAPVIPVWPDPLTQILPLSTSAIHSAHKMTHSVVKPKYHFISSELKLDLPVGPCLSYLYTWPLWRKRNVPPTRREFYELCSLTAQTIALLKITSMITSNITFFRAELRLYMQSLYACHLF